MSNKKVIVTIPAYNEEKYIADVVKKAKKYTGHVFVVNDASTDNTLRAARAVGAKVITHTENKKYGGAIKTCFSIAREEKADVLVTLDGDGQHDPSDIPKVLKPIISGNADIVVGSRFLGSNNSVPFYRKVGIGIITFLFNIGSKNKVSDSQSGFRAYNSRAISRLGKLQEECMGVSVELIINARRKGLRISEVPTKVCYHDDSSTMNPVKHGVMVAFTVLKLRIKLIKTEQKLY